MADRPFDRYLQVRTEPQTTTAEGFEVNPDAACVMLDLVFKSGDRLALSYSYLTKVELQASGSITLTFSTAMVTVEGRGLMPLHNALLSHMVRRISEVGSRVDPDDDKPWIKSIAVSAPADD
ncbi:MAG: hypothetical protein ACKVS8_08875 [Phycisphaerales bacterium]